MKLIVLFMPVIWALVSAGIGLILYRSSRAFFSGRDASDQTSRRIRLTGSVVIAALFFVLIRQSTPSANLVSLPDDSVVMNATQARELSRQTEGIESEAIELNACLAAAGASGVECRPDAERIRRLSGVLNDEVAGFAKSGGRADDQD